MKTNLFLLITILHLITKINSQNVSLNAVQNYSDFLNYGKKNLHKSSYNNLESKSKIDVLGEILKKSIESFKTFPKLEIVFLIDSSSSIGEYNFKSELKFVKKLLSDVIVDYNHTRIAVVGFSSSNNILKNVDEIGKASKNYNKCLLLTKQLKSIKFKGGQTFTLGALKTAKEIFQSSNRNDSKKVLFLITDGYSNGGDPIPVAKELKENSVTIFTIGIQNGNYKELYDISSTPGEYYSYLLDSFNEFENLARRALHSDLKNGDYIPLGYNELCNSLCKEGDCCDEKAACSCGTTTGHYSCICKPGYYGTGLKNNCFPCVSGTYSDGPNICLPCPDPYQITTKPGFGISSCECKEGYKATSNNKECKELKCHKTTAPNNGYFVKNKVCPNVIFSACGIRCEVGYILKGTSIRLCQKNGNWSGEEPKCEIKTCDQLEIPKNGKIECFQPDTEETFNTETKVLPVDTICKFTCNKGYLLSGSKERNCLPISRWSGLKTWCRPIKCKKLSPINFGTIDPPSCQFGRQEYNKVCNITCNYGFELDGPSQRRCGINGVWDNTFDKNVCKDITPPTISCPEDAVSNSLPGKKFGHATWTDPIAADNSNLNISIWMKPAIIDNKFEIGITKVHYFSQDVFQNEANCSFKVIIKDNEPPKFEDCVDPPSFLSSDARGTDISWDEPHAHDNSQYVTIQKSHDFGIFNIGTTQVTYIARDGSNNSNMCTLNITVEVSTCEPLPDPPNGQSICFNQTDGIRCLITCDEGYGVPITQITEKVNDTLLVCNNANPVWYSEDEFMLSECSVTQIPIEILEGEIVVSNINNCSDLRNIEEIKNDITFFINNEFCTDNCSLTTTLDCNNESHPEIIKQSQSSTIVKREAKRVKTRNRVNVKYHLKRKYHNVNRTFTHSQIELRGGYKGSLQYKTRIVCPHGSVQRVKRCVYCPKGTFHNETKNICQNCPLGQYNNNIGQTSCVQCPIHYSTRKLRSKKLEDCKEQCPPGTQARKKVQRVYKRFHNTTIEKTTLNPHCNSCRIGTYQPNFGELKCIACPNGYTTSTVGSTTIDQCIPTATELCRRNNTCNNGICTVINEYEFTCNCSTNYIVGTNCEQEINPCQSQPCYNEGMCFYKHNAYVCFCKEGYTGKLCENKIEVSTRACLNNGFYYVEDNGTSTCVCSTEYIGDSCEIKINACDEMFCENNSTCVEEDGRAYCKCSGGFIGRRCQLLPCDYKPCVDSKVCNNTYEDNSTKDSYLCICPDGYGGENCEERINYCLNSPCLNGGSCINENFNYTCACPSLYNGVNCQEKRNTKFMFNFNSYTTSEFVKLKAFPINLTNISTCLWIQTLDDVNYGTIISYATDSHDNAFTLTDYTGLVVYVNNQYVVTDIHLNDGLWHHVCVTWSSFNGAYQIFLDAKLVKFGLNLATGSQIQGMGSLILGQDQDILGGEFSQSESFVGKLTNVDIWSKILSQDNVLTHFLDCQDLFFGNLNAWPEMKDFAYGVKIEDSDFCKNCEAPKTLFNGYIELDNNIAYYSCYPGFTLNNPNFINGRKCTKASYWEGYYEPFCKKKYCGYPGSIRNGYTIGNKYFFEDKINYICYDGHNMSGNSTIVCNENGKWVPDKPRCIGTQCRAFKKPEDSRVVVMSDQSYEDYKENQTKFDVGTQIEIKCPNNTDTIGESILTCMENGFWDVSPPKCQTKPKPDKARCSVDHIPKAPPNGYIDIDSYNKVSNGTGHTIEYKCLNGYTLIGDKSTSCIVDGYWSEPKITCKSINCGVWPKFKNMLRDKGQDDRKIYNVGDKILFKCEDGYEKLGTNLSIRCLASSKWSRIQGKCLRKSCGKPLIGDETEIQGRSYLFGDTVKITCTSGSTYVLVCNKYGIWVGEKDGTC